MKKLFYLLLILLISTITFAQQDPKPQKLEIYGDILNDSLVNCSVFELVNGEPILLDNLILDENYYYANLDLYKTYSIVFEGSDLNKFIYISPSITKIIHLDVNFSNNDKTHCFIVTDKESNSYKLHLLSNEELKEAQKEFNSSNTVRL